MCQFNLEWGGGGRALFERKKKNRFFAQLHIEHEHEFCCFTRHSEQILISCNCIQFSLTPHSHTSTLLYRASAWIGNTPGRTCKGTRGFKVTTWNDPHTTSRTRIFPRPPLNFTIHLRFKIQNSHQAITNMVEVDCLGIGQP